eukprot:scaffold232731_cov21-Tisochrysis_lutea.AAC.1
MRGTWPTAPAICFVCWDSKIALKNEALMSTKCYSKAPQIRKNVSGQGGALRAMRKSGKARACGGACILV